MEEPVSSYPFHANEYPGKIPRYSYFLSKDSVHELHIVGNASLSMAIVDYNGEKIELSFLFNNLSAKPLKDRYAVVGYGSNACPSRLVEKGIFNLPVLKVTTENLDAVYAYEKTHYGDGEAVPATIVKSPRTLSKIWVTFLDEDQLKTMDKSEGRKDRYYDLVKLKNCSVTLPNGMILSSTYAYVANKKGIALKNSQPIALASIHADNRKLDEMYEREILKMIGNCSRGETADYLDFEVIPLGNLPEKFKNSTFQGIIIDPTILNDAKRLHSFLKSLLSKDYKVAISSDIYLMIKDGRWEELSKLLQNWEWNTPKEKLIEWHKSQEFRALCNDFVGLVAPCSEILEELSDEERSILRQLSRIIERGSPRIVKVAKELIMTSVVKKIPILSYSRHAKRWFKNCKNVLIIEITDAKNSISKAKKEIKMRVEKSGWSGHIALFVFGLTTDVALESVLPPPYGSLIGRASSGSFIVGVLADGKKIKE